MVAMSIEESATSVDHKRLVTLIDGSPDAQIWVDALVVAAQQGVGNWPHPHPDIPRRSITLAQLWDAIENSFTVGGEPWSITAFGFPPLPTLPPGARVGDREPDPPTNNGSLLHDAAHAVLGDFH